MRLRSIADTFGATGSLICAFHCLAGPIILLTGAVAPTVLLPDEAFHYAMLGLVVPAGVIAFAIGCREHRDRLTLCLGAVGLMSFVLVATVLHGLVGEVGERVLLFFPLAHSWWHMSAISGFAVPRGVGMRTVAPNKAFQPTGLALRARPAAERGR